jgi:hypothetical protein
VDRPAAWDGTPVIDAFTPLRAEAAELLPATN